MRALRVFASTAALLVLGSGAARADDGECIKAYEQTQTLRRATKLREARDEATKCARDTCPGVLAKDCTKWLGEIEASIPTVVFEARGAGGAELTGVRVSVDGAVVAERIDGKAVQLDIGPHTFRFEPEAGKGKPVEQHAVIAEGDKSRKITAVIVAEEEKKTARPIPVATWVFGGVGLASLGAGTFFALRGSSQESDLDGCRPGCSAASINDASRSYAFADVLFTAGVVSVIAAAYVFLARPTITSASTR